MSGNQLPWDFFHLGLLLVLIMVLITGVVIVVAVVGICCFHWLDATDEQHVQSRREKARHERTTISRLDNELNEEINRYKGKRHALPSEPPPDYDELFPTTPPSYCSNSVETTNNSNLPKPAQFILYV